MIPVVGVRFTKAGKVYYFDPGECSLEVGMRVIVETSQGVECGEIVVAPKLVPEEDVLQPLRRIIRIANAEDLQGISEARKHEKEAFAVACERVKKLALEMKIVDAEWTFDHQKLVFYFIADERVDFRELVKELAGVFRTRIELRQIGVRDQSKLLGGYGVCGRALCCSTWIGDFEPISIRHAKEQDLSLNPGKISGVCGRLKCCLRFEADLYHDIRKRMPKVGTMVMTPHGPAKVIELHIIKERVTVLFEEGDEFRRVQLSLDSIGDLSDGPQGLAYAEYAAASQLESTQTEVRESAKRKRTPAETPKREEHAGKEDQPQDAKAKQRSAKAKNHRRSRRSRHRKRGPQNPKAQHAPKDGAVK